MIGMVSKVKMDALTHELVDYLLGETDNIPKEPQWTFKLYRAIGNVSQAVKVAVNIAQKEQEFGNYKYAHEIMLDTYKDIREGGQRLPYELITRLVYLHSYALAKKKVKMGDHLAAARLLSRVCENISQFPQNMTNIMTTTIGECSQSGLKQEAYR
jgi:WD repeat-containing protein 19